MKLREISLTLFRQHLNSTVSFSEGLTAVIGPNGAGKSTLVEAIAFALFGTQAIRGKIDSIRTRTDETKKKHEPTVRLVLEHDGVVFTVERSTGNAALYIAGEARPIAEGNRDVTSRISSIIGMSYEEFIATYCTEQKGLEFLSGKRGATEREKFIIRMMGFDRLEDVQEKLRSDRKDKRSALMGFEASLGNRELLVTQLGNEKHQLGLVRTQHDEAMKVVANLEFDHEKRKKRMEVLEEMRTRFLKLAEQESSLQVRLDEKKKRRSAIEKELPEAMRSEADRSLWIAKQVSNLQNEIVALETREGSLRDSELEFRRQLEKAEVLWRESVTEARISVERVSFTLRDLIDRRKRHESLGNSAECPTCGQALADEWHGENAQIVEKISKLEGEVAAKRAEVAAAEAVPGPISDLRTQINGHQKEIAAAQTALTEQRRRLADLSRFERAAEELERLVLEESEIEKDREAIRRKVVDLRFSESEYSGEKGGYEATQRLLEVSRLQRVKLDGELRTKEALVFRTESDISHYDEKLTQVEGAKRDLKLLDESDIALTEFRKYLNSGIRPRLAELAGEYLADLTDGRYIALDLGSDFTPTVIDGGEPKPVISGGEEDILNLCMRLALSHMIADRAGQAFSLLILDEVFGSLDEGRRNNVLDLLEKLSKRFDQIIIITHLDDVKEGVRNAVYVDYDEETGTARIGEPESSEEAIAFNI